ncbi:MAG: helix-turn-helix domain-containing protein [Gemmatimonadaceae bacterium]|nr:helix-turn-helix domain-containing protein [Gemmatimonadaceae bacterium]
MPERLLGLPIVPTVVAYAPRERMRDLLKKGFPRRKGRLVIARSASDFAAAFHEDLIDAAIVDIAAPTDETWDAVGRALEFPSVPFFAWAAMRVADGPALARCARADFADTIHEGVDDVALRDVVLPQSFSVRFALALKDAAALLGIRGALQEKAWTAITTQGGRPVRTSRIAEELNVTREHLSRTFSQAGAPNLKRVIDLVRVIAAAELSKNPGYDVADVARVLGFASASHLSGTAHRIADTKPSSLARLRAADLIAWFAQGGRARSRKAPAPDA